MTSTECKAKILVAASGLPEAGALGSLAVPGGCWPQASAGCEAAAAQGLLWLRSQKGLAPGHGEPEAAVEREEAMRQSSVWAPLSPGDRRRRRAAEYGKVMWRWRLFKCWQLPAVVLWWEHPAGQDGRLLQQQRRQRSEMAALEYN